MNSLRMRLRISGRVFQFLLKLIVKLNQLHLQVGVITFKFKGMFF
jgi:hypothetical protein